MIDDLRSQADTTFEDDDLPPPEEPEIHTRRDFLGMSPLQRFIIAVLLLVIVLLLSSFCLLITGKIVLPV